ncbi:MAG: lysophospholipid transporter LplT [Betaproteobacteria bacterium]|jgi:LPLT family lysophospholipid transporter-like MFS transporter|nr:lysophospholipid transporter LplT [Rhodocyclaceae bacterium]MCA3133204.1 lysophospholipid transporter LplT [Rhodocyclaceae bacterium]MCA3140615.1 lysophospholipid transporter LplT [Rhodocyclaceae bacterium]MCA3144202.1 lysophospholipid transporter LplT [Rhodocyclaceae bacterium]MCE2897881.1 lysophospholipid transporter LplT [Betaproteobacteria bacterium]
MNRGFYTILAAQFFSALADNALLFAAIALLKELTAPDWQTPVLQQFFVFAYIALAPFVGPFADSLPKGRVMFVSNAVKIGGCAGMLAGLHPLYAYGIVGIGAAMYSPAKYGILTEFLPPSKLVLANGWMEGLTVASIILGAIVGGIMVGDHFSDWMFGNFPLLGDLPRLDSAPELAILVILLLYLVAALVNLYIPRVAIDHRLPRRDPLFLLQDFWHSLRLLWRDPLGQVSLAVTTLFWGAGATLRLIVLSWAALNLNFSLEQATQLTAVVAVGIAIGSVLAAKLVTLERSIKVLPVGIAMGLLVCGMALVHDWRLAVVLLIATGAMGGFFVVPMNALLQHRGHLLMGAGHSIAVQNFNENLSILAMLGCYALMLKAALPLWVVIVLFGVFVAGTMTLIWRRHRHDQDVPPAS